MKEDYFNKFKSSMPPHLSPEEKEEWLKDEEWNRQEFERRKREGFYPNEENNGIVSKIKRRFNLKQKKDNKGTTWYG